VLAYIDPGTGSYFFQILIASALGGLFFARQQIARLVVFFKNLLTGKKDGRDSGR
jgi:hypothetical protein